MTELGDGSDAGGHGNSQTSHELAVRGLDGMTLWIIRIPIQLCGNHE